MKNNQKGFGVIEVVISILVVGLLVFGGWYVWQANNTPAVLQTAAQGTPSDNTNNNGDGETKYLSVQEWGIKFALTTDTADAYYDAKTSSSLQSYSLRSHSLDAVPNCKDESQSIATIFRVPKDEMNQDGQPDKMYRETQEGKVIGNYFYFISGAQYACTEDPSLAPILQGVRNAFVTASLTIQQN